jgi:hypothetical protein
MLISKSVFTTMEILELGVDRFIALTGVKQGTAARILRWAREDSE